MWKWVEEAEVQEHFVIVGGQFLLQAKLCQFLEGGQKTEGIFFSLSKDV